LAIKKPKKRISIEASRKTLLKALSKNCKGEIVKKSIQFNNDDVPKYLEWLEKREREAKMTRILVG
jgi:hypothetical protein